MKISELESKHLKNKAKVNLKSCKKQRSFCNKSFKNKRKKYHERLDLNNVIYNKKIWKTVKLFLSDQITTFSTISQVENGEIIPDKSKVANSISNFFENTILLLDIKTNEYSQ